MSRWYGWERYPRSTPREAKGGIKAQTKRGGFGKSWWAQRWIATLESFDIGARLSRGRSYARSGQVLSIEIDKGSVVAQVQGSRPKPYAIEIKVKTLANKEWKKLADALSAQALFAAKLLAGEMPEQIEDAFKEVGLSLFPEKQGDLDTDCSCPDWSNPCKHIAAVYYLLGEEFDRDPFLIFKLRGMTREELLPLLHSATEQAPAEGPVEPVATPEPLSPDPAAFWRGGRAPEDVLAGAQVPPIAAALPKRLGNFPFWRARMDLHETLDAVYRGASESALKALTK